MSRLLPKERTDLLEQRCLRGRGTNLLELDQFVMMVVFFVRPLLQVPRENLKVKFTFIDHLITH
jgi:hypothetical protein